MDYLILALVAAGCFGLLFFIRKIYLAKVYPKQTEKLFTDLKGLENLGFVFTGDKYEGNFKGFLTYVFVTSNMRGSDQVMVMMATDTASGPFKFLNTFITGYFINGENGGCTYIGFRLFMRTLFDPSQGVQHKLDKLILLLNENGVRPYKT